MKGYFRRILFILAITAVTTLCLAANAEAWWNASWKKRRKITFDKSPPSQDLSFFPVLIKLNCNRIDYAQTQDQGQDIRFVDADDTTLLPHEIEKWEESGDSNVYSYVWVRVPQINSSSPNTYIYMYYGNSNASDGQNITEVWNGDPYNPNDDFKMVQHLQETSGTHCDSTGNGNDSTAVTVTNQGSATGKIDGADALDGNDDFISFGTGPAIGAGPFTTSFWVKSNQQTDEDGFLYSQRNGGFVGEYYFKYRKDDQKIEFSMYDGNVWEVLPSTTQFNDNSWHLIHGVKLGDNQKFRIYVDGNQEAESTDNQGSLNSSLSNFFGKDARDGINCFEGDVDEIRVATVARSNAWITAEYESERDNFATYGSEQSHTTAIYYSVGDRSLTLYSGTASASNGVLTLDSEAADKIGVGDEIQEDSNYYYIRGRNSSNEFYIQTATGGTNISFGPSAPITIKRAFNSLSDAYDYSSNSSHLTTTDLVTDKFQLNWACYADAVMTSGLTLSQSGWTTGPDNHIRIYTPTSTSEVGMSQRHNGTWGTGFMMTYGSGTSAFNVSEDYVRIEGIAIQASSTGTTSAVAITHTYGAFSDNNDVRINDCVIVGQTGVQNSRAVYIADSGFKVNVTIRNTIAYNHAGLAAFQFGTTSGPYGAKTIFCYNCTAYNNLIGFNRHGVSETTVILKNCLSLGNTQYDYAGTFDNSSNYNMSSFINTDYDSYQAPGPDYGTGTTTQTGTTETMVYATSTDNISAGMWFNNTKASNPLIRKSARITSVDVDNKILYLSEPIAGQAAGQPYKVKHSAWYRSASNNFMSTTANYENLHLKSGADAIDVGTNLSTSFNTDIDGQARFNPWDMGADEYFLSTSSSTITVDDGIRTWVFMEGMLWGPKKWYHTSVDSGTENLISSSATSLWGIEGQGTTTDPPVLLESSAVRTRVMVKDGSNYTITTVYPSGKLFQDYSVNYGSGTQEYAVHRSAAAAPQVSNRDNTDNVNTVVFSDSSNNNYAGISIIPYIPDMGVTGDLTNNDDSGNDKHTYHKTAALNASGQILFDASNYRATTTTRDNARYDYRNPDALSNFNTGSEGWFDSSENTVGGSGATSWWNSSWTKRRKITFGEPPKFTPSQDLSDFPVLIKLNSSRIDYNNTQDQGQDIRFVADDDTTLLLHEIEKWNESGDSYVWVKVNPIKSSSPYTYIYMYYGNTTAPAPDPETIKQVWNDGYFRMVHHLKEESGTHYDSTSNNNHSTEVDVTAQGSYAGKINGADYLYLIDSDAGVKINDRSSLDITQQITIEAWVKADTCYRHRIVDKNNAYMLRADTISGENSDHLHGYVQVGASSYKARSEQSTIKTDGSYQYVVFTWDGRDGEEYDNKLKLYIDGSEVTYYAQDTYQGEIDASEYDLWIGSYGTGGEESWNGGIDEVRVSAFARSPAWIAAQYNSMTDNFATFGDEVLPPNDFFNEAEGCYAVKMADYQKLVFDIHGSPTNPRYSPTFKIRNYRSLGDPKVVYKDSDKLAKNEDYNVAVIPFSEAWYSSATADPSWWNISYSRRRKITFNNCSHPQNLSNFPVLIKLDSSRIDYGQTKDQGQDIRFFDPDTSEELPYEIEKWDESGTSYVWVKVPQIDASSNTDHIWMYYGNGSATDNQDPSEVWSTDYWRVWHMHNYNLSGSYYWIYDSVNESYSAYYYPTSEPTTTDGLAGKATSFNGSGQYIDSQFNRNYGTEAASWEVVWKANSWSPDSTRFMIGLKTDVNSEVRIAARVQSDNTDGFLQWYLRSNEDFAQMEYDPGNVFDGSWHYSVLRRQAGGNQYAYGYLDGNQVTSYFDFDGSIDLRCDDIGIARVYNCASGETGYFPGYIDEVRFAKVDHSEYWIAAQYKSMTDTFATYGDEEYAYDTRIAAAGLTSSDREYLAREDKDYELKFNSGDYLYLGSTSKFSGVNIDLETNGAGGTLNWKYWNGTQWSSLSNVNGPAEHFTDIGFVTFDQPEDWEKTSINNGTSLYYVRASLAGGSYTTKPKENLIKTDILLLQYLGDITGTTISLIGPTEVDLLSFTATGAGDKVRVEWETAQEINNLGCNLYRSAEKYGSYQKLNSSLIPGLLYSVTGKKYTYDDRTVTKGQIYYYKLEDIDGSGTHTWHGPVCVDWDGDGMPDDWEIAHGLDPTKNDGNLDYDNDGLTNYEEYQRGTDPFNPDTDGDRIPDGQDRGGLPDTSGGGGSGDGVKVISRDETGMVLELRTSGFDSAEIHLDGKTYQRLSIPTYTHGLTETVGSPELPVKGYWVDLPAGMEISLQVENVETQTLPGYLVYPVPEKIALEEEVREQFVIDPGAYAKDCFLPEERVKKGTAAYFRDQKKAQLLFSPISFNPQAGQLQLHTLIRVRVGFIPTQGAEMQPLGFGTSRFGMAAADPNWPPSADALYRITTTQEGIHRIGTDELAAAGMEISSIDPRALHLYNRGNEVALHISGEEDGVFDPTDCILFYAEAINSKYTKTNVYWLVEEQNSGPRMLSTDGSPQGGLTPQSFTARLHHEPEQFYWGLAPGTDDLDRWFSSQLIWGKTSVDIPLPVREPTPAGQAKLHIRLWSFFQPGEHHISATIGGQLIGQAQWRGQESVIITGTVDQALLATWTLRLQSTGPPLDLVLIDWVDLQYQAHLSATDNWLRFSSDPEYLAEFSITGFSEPGLLVFDITDPLDVGNIEGFEITGPPYALTFHDDSAQAGERAYIALGSSQLKTAQTITQTAPPGLLDTRHGADYILIAHRDIGWDAQGNPYGWLRDLLEYRQSQGLRSFAVSTDQIYDQFNYGISDPQAIKDFLGYAYANWTQPAPQYVLLVGDASFDPKGNSAPSGPGVPTYLGWTRYMGETAIDDWFAQISGQDALPDLYLGRLPAADKDQAQIMVGKIISYEEAPKGQPWQKRLLLVSDDQEPIFEQVNEAIANLVPMDYSLTKGYLAQYKIPPKIPDDLTTRIIDEINQGVLVVNYVGHGSTQHWAHESILYTGDDIPRLSNEQRLPIMLLMTCLNGYFILPERCLAEQMLLSDGAGAVAVFTSTGMTDAQVQRLLDQGFIEAAFQGGITRLGQATGYGKQVLLANSSDQEDTANSFSLMGDPAMTLGVQPSSSGSTPAVAAGGGGGGGCFVASAAYGSFLDGRVGTLRSFRDGMLKRGPVGRWLVKTYYGASPPAARWIRGHENIRTLTRIALVPVVAIAGLELNRILVIGLTLLVLITPLAWTHCLTRRGMSREGGKIKNESLTPLSLTDWHKKCKIKHLWKTGYPLDPPPLLIRFSMGRQ